MPSHAFAYWRTLDACVQGEVPLLTPDILVCSVGTEILINGAPAGRHTSPPDSSTVPAAGMQYAADLPGPQLAAPHILPLAYPVSLPAGRRPPAAGQPDEEWEAYLNQGWDRPRAAEIAAQLPELVMQRDSEQRSHKISYKLR